MDEQAGLALVEVEPKLFLGNVYSAKEGHDHEFDHVLTVSENAQPLTTDHQPLRDDLTISYEQFEAAVELARERYREEGSLLIHCSAGLSRSVTVMAAMLTAEGVYPSFEHAVAKIQQSQPEAYPNPALLEQAEQYLGRNIEQSVVHHGR
ncbi:protein-tyrosine phosphatase family protein [Halosegnis longus]|uniref:protein-tyrosine-phosphatase n=1 Tax=Halosegnis longus TaxID=2216012 RepID=A0AAJ4UWW9_9EURY|nr:dual specificity protein phosphatase [Halosegnis longus]RNJ27309.1 phosphatase [Salella cibi]